MVELADAYRVLEIAPGASRDDAREARNVLAKVWHPDRHQGDPKVYERADLKLRQINEAYAAIEAAGFPKVELPQREAPAFGDSLAPRANATPTHVVRDPSASSTLMPRRRIRMWVPFALGALGAAIVIALFLKNASPSPAPAPIPTPTPLPVPTPVPTIGFTLGSTREAVRRVMGEPTRIDHTFGERWAYGMAEVTFHNGVVTGWRSSAFDKLKVTLAATDPKIAADARVRGTYGPHASRDEVLGVEGPPDGIDDAFGETWSFGMSHLTFDPTGHINEIWDTSFNPLHVKR